MYPSENKFDLERVSLINSEDSADESTCEEKFCDDENEEERHEDETGRRAKRKLVFAAVLSLVFMVIELSGGYLAGSLAIMSDAAHLITDSLTFIIGVVGITWARKSPDSKMSFGYKRVEVFCALFSIIGIWILTLFILYFAVQRLFDHDGFEIDPDTMLKVSILGVFVNIVMVIILHCDSCHSLRHNHSHDSCNHRLKTFRDDDLKSLQIDDRKLTKPQTTQSSSCKSENINVQAAFLHVIGDLIQSIGVIIAAIVIKFYPQAKIVDPLITLSFSIIVIFTTVKIFRKSAGILLEAVPGHISYDDLLCDLKKVEGVCTVKDLKIWSLSDNYHILTVKLVIGDLKTCKKVLENVKRISKSYGFSEETIQIESRWERR